MPTFRVIESVLREHYVEAADAEQAKKLVIMEYTVGEDYDWKIVDVEEQEENRGE